MTDLIDSEICEHCNKEHPIESGSHMEDCWICDGCYAEWKAHFDACQHRWKPYVNEFVEPSQYCEKCAGVVRDEDMGLIDKALVADGFLDDPDRPAAVTSG